MPFWLQKKYIFLFLILCGVLFSLSFHVIRVEGGFELITKGRYTFEDTYVDVRDWTLVDYFSHSPRIRNYLFFEKPYNQLLELIQEKREELEERKEKHQPPSEPSQSGKKKLESTERDIYNWIRRRFE